MRILIAVMTCHMYRHKADAQRDTWAREVDGADLRFFVGRSPGRNWALKTDEVELDVDDGYFGLVEKSRAICRWALEQGYDYLFKTDDDVYVRPERLLRSGFERGDYSGRLRGPSGGFPAPYASGLGYWLSRRAMEVVSRAVPMGHTAEDRWVGNVLLTAGIVCRPDYRYAVVQAKRAATSAKEGPRNGNDIIAACEYEDEQMKQAHEEWLHVPSNIRHGYPPMSGPLSRVSIMIKTFLRDGYLRHTVENIRRFLPECRMIIVDDGHDNPFKIPLYAKLRARGGHHCVWLPFDSGFGAKANAAIPFMDREFVLIASDDFDFSNVKVRADLKQMIMVLDHDLEIQMISGRVNNRPYEMLLEEGEDWVRETLGWKEEREFNGAQYRLCDVTVNYSLARSWIFKRPDYPQGMCWDGGEVKIGGGEHGAFFLDMKRRGYGVAYLVGASIQELPLNTDWMHPAYPEARARAREPGRACLLRRGIKYWQLSDGTWERC